MSIFKKAAVRINSLLKLFGFDFYRFAICAQSVPYFVLTFLRLRAQKGHDQSFQWGKIYPMLADRRAASGKASGHYFHQDMIIARRIFENNPVKHVDIGSRVDGFVAHVAVFRNIEVFDIRAQSKIVKNIFFKQLDLMESKHQLNDYCDSLSCLHAIEHFGLGRYGDPINYDGHIKALSAIARIIKTNGRFYFSVPIGRQRIEFNAHRVFSVKYLMNLVQKDFVISCFSYISDAGDLYENVDLSADQVESNFGCHYGCGIFELIRR